jgi:hypothetical protein
MWDEAEKHTVTVGFYAGPAPNDTPGHRGRRILADELSRPRNLARHHRGDRLPLLCDWG